MGPYAYRCDDVRPIRFSWPSAAAQRQFAVCVDLRAPKRPSAAFLLRASAKMPENDGKTFSNFSLKVAIMKIEVSTRNVPSSVVSAPFEVPRRVKK